MKNFELMTSYYFFCYTGDVVTPGFFREFPTAEDILYRPYGSGEMNMFNFAYNLLTLKFKKANQQLSNDILQRSLRYMNIGQIYFSSIFT